MRKKAFCTVAIATERDREPYFARSLRARKASSFRITVESVEVSDTELAPRRHGARGWRRKFNTQSLRPGCGIFQRRSEHFSLSRFPAAWSKAWTSAIRRSNRLFPSNVPFATRNLQSSCGSQQTCSQAASLQSTCSAVRCFELPTFWFVAD